MLAVPGVNMQKACSHKLVQSSCRRWLSIARPATQHLPVVDVAALTKLSSPSEQLQVGKAVDSAFREKGFLYVTGHGVDAELQARILNLGREFFALSTEEKGEITITENPEPFQAPVRGYQQVGDNITQAEPDMHEAIDFWRDCPPQDLLGLFEAAHPLAGVNKWPRRPEGFKDAMTEYIEQMLQLGASILKGIALANNLPLDYFSSFYNDPFWCTRMIRYPPAMKNLADGGLKEPFGCGRHTDYGCLTFVLSDNVPNCLQVQDSQGQWVDAQPVPGAFVVNCGDMLSRWTSSAYQSTPHRVLSPVGSERISVPFFFEPNFDARIQPLGGLNPTKSIPDDELMEPVLFGDHVSHRILSNFKYSADVDVLNTIR